MLARDDIGRAKPCTYNLPTEGHVYGVPNKQEKFGVGKLTSAWHLPEIKQHETKERDFRKMNMMGADAKIIAPNKVREFRQ